MTPAEAAARLRLIRTEGVGPVGFARLVARFGSAAAALDALPDLAGRHGAAGLVPPPPAAVEAELAAVASLGGCYLHLGAAGYPGLLAEAADAPPVLVALGDPALGARPAVAIVGARNASAAGRRLAAELAAGLGALGFVIVSGLARGIDAAAHEAALATGTIACVAGGVDIAYPPEHGALQHAIAARGLLLAELPPGTQPQARHFPRRNRLIAGIALGLVVVEAAEGSGSLITARLAGELGREVMAVPGHPADPRSRGGNRLIREGAALVEAAGDVAAVLDPFGRAASRSVRVAEPAPAPAASAAAAAPAAAAVDRVDSDLARLLGTAPVPLDELVRQSGLDVAAVLAWLADRELDGSIARHAGGRVSLA